MTDMTEEKPKKEVSPRTLLWAVIIEGVALGALILFVILQSFGVFKPKQTEPPAIVIINYPPQGVSDVEVPNAGQPTGGDVQYTMPLDTTPDIVFDWRYAIRWLDFAPGEGYLARRDTSGRKWLDVIGVPKDLNYEVEVETDSVTGQVHAAFRKISIVIPAESRTLLAVRFKLGVAYRPGTPDSLGLTRWGFGPQGSVGIVFSPWKWLNIIPLEASYPLSVGAGVEINVPIWRE